MLLDAGCGTGSYSEALIDRVKRIEAVDASDGMLGRASRKLKRYYEDGRISFTQAKLDLLPFEASTFDGIMINQVLHHIDDPIRKGYPGHQRIFKEFYRVLRPGGLIVINTCSPKQLKHGYWYYDFIPEAAEKFRMRFVPPEILCQLLDKSGIKCHEQFTPFEEVFQGDAYFDIYGPLKETWRSGDSIFALATKAELDRAMARINELGANDDLAGVVDSLDQKRKSIGQATFLLSFRK